MCDRRPFRNHKIEEPQKIFKTVDVCFSVVRIVKVKSVKVRFDVAFCNYTTAISKQETADAEVII